MQPTLFVDGQPKTPTKMGKLLIQAVVARNMALAKVLIAQGADPSEARDARTGATALMHAAMDGDAETIYLLAPLSTIASTDTSGNSSLHFFVSRMAEQVYPPENWKQSLRLLISQDCASKQNNDGLTPLALAAKSSWHRDDLFIEVAEELAPQSNLSTMDFNGLTPCALALHNQHCSGSRKAQEILRLDPLRAQSLDAKHPQHGSLAHMAARGNHHKLISSIAAEANLESRDSMGETPLMTAVKNMSFEAMDTLLEHGAKANAVDNNGRDALMLGVLASRDPKTRLRSRLWPRLTSLICRSDLLLLDVNGLSAFDHALAGQATMAMLIWDHHPDQAEFARTQNKDGETLAHVLARKQAPHFLSAVCCQDNLSAPDPRGRTPLMAACFDGPSRHEESIAMLAPWSDCRATDHDGCDALMLAIEGSSEEDCCEIIEALVARSDLAHRDRFGESALDKAAHRNYAKFEKIIQARLSSLEDAHEIATATASATDGTEAAERCSARL